MLALTEYENQLCECGLHESVADEDPDLEFVFRKCPVCASRDKQLRVLKARDDAEVREVYGEKAPPPEAELPDDGRHIGLRRKLPTS